jgi:hypothetical protein
MTVSINGTSGLTFNDASTQNTAATGFGFKNRILNGSMVLDQRNAGASVTATNSAPYTLDRWQSYSSTTSKFTVQQDAGAVTPPAGFTDYLGITSTSAYSVTSGDQMIIQQQIEGYNVADLAFGTASASPVTLSFWVRSSLTGTFGGALQNSAQNRNYPFSYTISAANTWEQKSITVAGDTTGTWLTTNGKGLNVVFSLGTGSTYSATAGSWTSTASITSATGATSVVGTSGATFYITGVQLEKGSTATSFDYRPYGTELQLCQRYFQMLASGADSLFEPIASGMALSSTDFYYILRFNQQMRASATMASTGTVRYYYNGGSGTAGIAFFDNTTSRSTRINVTGSGAGGGNGSWIQLGGSSTDRITASAEL